MDVPGLRREWSRERARCAGNQSVRDRKSTRLNSSHSQISYAVFCLKKKKHESGSFEQRGYAVTYTTPALRSVQSSSLYYRYMTSIRQRITPRPEAETLL